MNFCAMPVFIGLSVAGHHSIEAFGRLLPKFKTLSAHLSTDRTKWTDFSAR